MDTEFAKRLCALNTSFYANQAESFSETRNAPWHGWQRCSEILSNCLSSPNESPTSLVSSDPAASTGVRASATETPSSIRCAVLDVACGNLRFEKYLQQEFTNCEFAFHAQDNCAPLVESGLVDFPLEFEQRDIVSQLIDLDIAHDAPLFKAGAYDVVCSFGFMHHVPGRSSRLALVRELVKAAKPGGLVLVSFWRFMANEKLAKKAVESTNRGVIELGFNGVFELEDNDYLLGWKDVSGAYRYCHHFDDEEIQSIIESVSDCAEVLDTFTADGKTDDLNEYLVLHVR